MALIIYLACDDEAKEKLGAEESEGSLTLKGTDRNTQRYQFIPEIIKKISYETPTEKCNEKLHH